MSLPPALWLAAANDLVFLVPLGLVAGWLVDARVDSFFVFAVVIVSLAVSYGFGLMYAHPAPYQVHQTMVSGPPENAFPSQHTVVLFAFSFGAFVRRHSRVGIAFLGLAVVVGIARVHVGDHWPVDVYGSGLAAIVGTGLTFAVDGWVDRLAVVAVAIDDWLRSLVGLAA